MAKENTMQELESITSYPAFADLKIIDMDTHWSEPMDLWESRATGSLKNRVPRVVQKDGMANWVIGEDETVIQMASPLSVIGRDAKKIYGGEFFSSTFDQVHPASWDLNQRIQFMDALGIHAQILYPNVGGIGFTYFRSEDKDLKTAVTQIYNDAAAEIQSDTGSRILPMAVIPFWDIQHAVKEVERAMKMGLHGIVLGGDVHLAGMPDLGQDYWNPLWELCESEEIPINFHIGGSDLAAQNMKNASWPTFGAEAYLALGSSVMYIENARVIGNLIYSGVPERFPDIQFVSVESGLGWLPFYLSALDYQLTETAPSEATKLSLKPTEYFRRNFYASFWFETDTVAASIQALGADRVMFETDFPHPTCLYPGPLEYLKRSIGSLDSTTQRKVLQDNAAKLYKIPV